MSKVSIQSQSAVAMEELERRRSQRAELIVRVDYSTVDELFSEFTADINEGGLFIETEQLRPTGTEVVMHFNLPGREEALRTSGRVVRTNDGSSGGAMGMGIEFDELSDDDRQRIDALVRALRTGKPTPVED